MEVLHLVIGDSSSEAAALAEQEAGRLEESGRYRGSVLRAASLSDLTRYRSRIRSAIVHLWADANRSLSRIASMKPLAMVCDLRAGGSVSKGAAERQDADFLRFIMRGDGNGFSAEVESLYDELCAAAGLPVPPPEAEAPGGNAAGAETAAAGGGGTADSRPLRILMVTQEDPFYLPLFFKEFFRIAAARRRLSGGHAVEVAGVMVQRPLGNRTVKGLLKRLWRLYGTLGLARVSLRYAAVKLAPWRLGVAGEAARAGVRILELRDANSDELVSLVKREEIDLVVSVSASQIFKAPILAAPRLGCINLHNAPLPHYRGMLPNFWQMYHGEPESVLTIHYMVEDLDKGDILLQRPTPITPEMSLETLMRRTKLRSARALWNVLDALASGAAAAAPLPEEPGSYFSWPTREEARELRRRGKRLL